jgi:hypothetical protein
MIKWLISLGADKVKVQKHSNLSTVNSSTHIYCRARLFYYTPFVKIPGCGHDSLAGIIHYFSIFIV